jgi:hypothetical protein
MDVTDRSSSKTGNPLPFNQDDEKSEEPNASEMFPLGSVNEPDLNRLLRSDNTEDEATEAE